MKTANLNAIDPALAALADFSKVSQGTSQHINAMRQQAIFTDGALPARLKALAAALWGISARCEPCLKFYMLKAKELGATEAEIGEMLAVASTMGGCVGEMWAVKAFHAANPVASEEACCTV